VQLSELSSTAKSEASFPLIESTSAASVGPTGGSSSIQTFTTIRVYSTLKQTVSIVSTVSTATVSVVGSSGSELRQSTAQTSTAQGTSIDAISQPPPSASAASESLATTTSSPVGATVSTSSTTSCTTGETASNNGGTSSSESVVVVVQTLTVVPLQSTPVTSSAAQTTAEAISHGTVTTNCSTLSSSALTATSNGRTVPLRPPEHHAVLVTLSALEVGTQQHMYHRRVPPPRPR
jgi:hypothetical protein